MIFLKNKKILALMVVSILFCCGWKAQYNLEINNGDFSEKILFTFDENIYSKLEKIKKDDDGEYIERSLVYGDIFAVNDEKKLYKKEINSADISTVKLSYTYTFAEFNNSKYINNCFSNFYTEETSKYYYVKAYGKFNCLSKGIEEINIKTNNKIEVNSNATKNSNNSYTWKLNNDLNNIEFKIFKEKNNNVKYLIYSSTILLIVLVILIYIKRFKKINKI